MALSKIHAEQIAALLNARNQLTKQYTCQSVLVSEANYFCCFAESGEVAACVELKKVQWYQAEVCHLTVAEGQTKKGYAKALLAEVERAASELNVRLLQCTIREDNSASRTLFENFGYEKVGAFHNLRSGNNVEIFQKVLCNAR